MVVVLCNCTPEEADALASALVEERLAACVNAIGGVRSTYRWEGSLVTDVETTLILKVPTERVDALRERLTALHSYDTPEILVLQVDVARSHPGYVGWVRALLEEA